MMSKIAAFFDIDGTIFRNALMIEHFRKMINYEIIDPTIWYTEIQTVYQEWENRFQNFDHFFEKLAAMYLQALKGEDLFFIERIADHVIRTNGDMVYIFAREQIKWHKEHNHLIFFISGSPDFLVSRMAEKYEVTEWRGTKYLVDENNKLTGDIKPMWDSLSKQNEILELIEKYDIDTENSFAYGDTTGDVSMLKNMGNAIAINPNRALIDAIKNDIELLKKTKIVVERKDAVYVVDGNVKLYERGDSLC